MTDFKRSAIALALFVAAVAGFFRWQAVTKLPVDYDELVYLPVAFRYQEMIIDGKWKEIIYYRENLEHPPLNKLLFAFDLVVRRPPEPEWDSLGVGQQIPSHAQPAFLGPRLISAIGGTLQVLVLSLIHPIAGILLAFNTYHIKYSAQVYLEGVPGFLAVLSVFFFERAVPAATTQSSPLNWRLLVFSAIALGLAAAQKYLYGIVGLVLLAFLIARNRAFRSAGIFSVLALASFLIADPFLWTNPPARLWESLTYHWRYSHSEHVISSGMPWFSPFVHLLRSAPSGWHPGVFYTRLADWIILPLSLIGASRAWQKRPIWLAWAIFGLLFLLIWPTKWPQYILLVLPPLAVCAAFGIEQLRAFAGKKFR